MAEELQNMFPRKPEDPENDETEAESGQENIPVTENIEFRQEEQPETDAAKAEPGLDVSAIEKNDQDQVELARQNLDQAYGMVGTGKTVEQPKLTEQITASEPGQEQLEDVEDPADRLQAMVDRAKEQYDRDMATEQAPIAETTPETEPEKISEEERQIEAENEIIKTAEAVEGDVEDAEMTPEMREYVDGVRKRMEQELAGMEEMEGVEDNERKERPRRSALKKAMLVVTAAAALWMFQATTAPDTAYAGGKQTSIEKFEKQQKKRMEKTAKRIEKIPEKLAKGAIKDLHKGVSKGINGVAKDLSKAIGGIFK